MIGDLFRKHPASVGETYGEHLVSAWRFGLAMIAAGLACLVHGFLPFLFARTGSRAVAGLYGRMLVNRVRPPRGGAWQDFGAHI